MASLPVTVIVPVYNRASLLEQCLAGVWAQRPYPPAEVLVIDDGSADETAEVAADLGARVVRHPQNRGLAAARNTGLEAAKHEWAALLDSDDEWLPHHLWHLWGLRGEHALVGSSVLAIASEPPSIRARGPVAKRPLVLSDATQILSPHNLFSASASMVHRDVALSVGGFKPHFGVVEDLDLWVRILERHTAVCSPTISVIYHVHGEQMSQDVEAMHKGHRAVADGHTERTGRGEATLKRWEGVAAWDMLRMSLADRNLVAALGSARSIAVSPQRVIGVASLLSARMRDRRKTARLGYDARPSVAVFVHDDHVRSETLSRLRGRTVRELTSRSALVAVLSMLRTPAGMVVVESEMSARMLRLMRVPAVSAERVPSRVEGSSLEHREMTQ